MFSKHLTSYIISGVVLLAVFIVPSLFRLLTDWYWFQEIGFGNIFITILSAKIFLGLAVGILSFSVFKHSKCFQVIDFARQSQKNGERNIVLVRIFLH
mgnify:CR=1 FL=1